MDLPTLLGLVDAKKVFHGFFSVFNTLVHTQVDRTYGVFVWSGRGISVTAFGLYCSCTNTVELAFGGEVWKTLKGKVHEARCWNGYVLLWIEHLDSN